MRVIRLDQLQPFQAVNVLLDPGAIGGPVVIPSCWQIGVQWTLTNGKIGHNVLYGRIVPIREPTQADANAFLAQLHAGAPWTTLAAFLASTASLSAVTMRSVDTADRPLHTSNGAATPGTSASPALPDEVALAITYSGDDGTRTGRGRFYIPGWATNSLGTGGTVAAGAVTALSTWASNNVPQAFGTFGGTMVVGLPARQSYTGSTGTVHPARAAASVPIDAILVKDNHWDSQRRRGLR